MWDMEDLCWSCPHRECFFGIKGGAVKTETKMYVDGTPYVSWYDLYEQDLEERKAAAEPRREKSMWKRRARSCSILRSWRLTRTTRRPTILGSG